MGFGLGTKKGVTRQYIRIALHIQNVLQILKTHKVQNDLKREFNDWDFQFTFSLPPFLVAVLLISVTQVVIICGSLLTHVKVAKIKNKLVFASTAG